MDGITINGHSVYSADLAEPGYLSCIGTNSTADVVKRQIGFAFFARANNKETKPLLEKLRGANLASAESDSGCCKDNARIRPVCSGLISKEKRVVPALTPQNTRLSHSIPQKNVMLSGSFECVRRFLSMIMILPCQAALLQPRH